MTNSCIYFFRHFATIIIIIVIIDILSLHYADISYELAWVQCKQPFFCMHVVIIVSRIIYSPSDRDALTEDRGVQVLLCMGSKSLGIRFYFDVLDAPVTSFIQQHMHCFQRLAKLSPRRISYEIKLSLVEM